MNRILGTLLLASFCFSGTTQSLQEKLLAKMQKKNATTFDESMALPMKMYLDGGSTATTVIADGTRTIAFKCAISDQASSLKKEQYHKTYYYTFLLKITSAAIDQDKVGFDIYSDASTISKWSEAEGFLEFELDQSEILRHLDYSIAGEKYEIEATLITNIAKGSVLLSKGQFAVSSNPNGKWASATKEKFIESYRTGRLEERNNSAPIWKRMLAYTENKWPGAEILHLKVHGSGITDDNRLNTEIFVTYRKDGVCTYTSVSVWEDRYQLTLDNYKPQYASNPNCEGLDEIRNVR